MRTRRRLGIGPARYPERPVCCALSSPAPPGGAHRWPSPRAPSTASPSASRWTPRQTGPPRPAHHGDRRRWAATSARSTWWRPRHQRVVRELVGQRLRPGARRRDRRGGRGPRRRPGRLLVRPHLPDAPGRQDRDDHARARSRPATTSRSPTCPASPGCARPSPRTARRPSSCTLKRNMVAVITNGTAVLGLGDIGAAAGMPVMEGKSMLFKEFGSVDSYPICIDSKDPEVLIKTIAAIAPGLGRHQPRGHRRAGVLRGGGPAQGDARHPGLPRRPARHRRSWCWPRCSTR